MAEKEVSPSIFSGVDDKVDAILQLSDGTDQRFATKAASDQLTIQGRMKIGSSLVRGIYDQIERNWKSCATKPIPAKELWVPRRRLDWSWDFKSAEVPLERSTVALFKFYDVLRKRLDDAPNPSLTWFNQVPVASGIVSSKEGKNAINLICRTANGAYDFVELKFPKRGSTSETPLKATIQILKNGLLYLFTRRYLPDLGNQGYEPQLEEGQEIKDIEATEILEASEISLCVLAPRYFYTSHGYDLAWLEDELNEGLEDYLANHPIEGISRVTFRYEFLPDRPFEITEGNGFKLDFTRRHLDNWNSTSSKIS
jgi:hypothetical protein